MALSASATSHTIHPSGSFIAIGSGKGPIISALVPERSTSCGSQKMPRVFFLQYPAPMFIQPDSQGLPSVGLTS